MRYDPTLVCELAANQEMPAHYMAMATESLYQQAPKNSDQVHSGLLSLSCLLFSAVNYSGLVQTRSAVVLVSCWIAPDTRRVQYHKRVV